jgi:hypothetical protein
VNGTRIAVGREGTACRTPTATSKKREGVECQEYAIALWVTGAQAEAYATGRTLCVGQSLGFGVARMAA